MNSFVVYEENELIHKNYDCIPSFCKKCIKEKNKNCLNHYMNLNSNVLVECPYGFYSYKVKDSIFTSFVIYGSKAVEKIKIYKDKNINIFKYDFLLDLLCDFNNILVENNELHSSIHDLRNIGTYFNSMKQTIENKFESLLEDDDIKAMLSLYDLVNYRLSLTGRLPEIGFKKQNLTIHHVLHKLRIIMSYKAKNKDITIRIDDNNDIVLGNDLLYLVLFIVFENAIKYSPPQNEILVYFEKNDNILTINVQNIGNTLYDEEINKLTNKGYRGINSKVDGSGYGLYILKEICDKSNFDYSISHKYINSHNDLFLISISLIIV